MQGELKRLPPVEHVSHLPPEQRPYRCMFDGATFATAGELFAYIREKHVQVAPASGIGGRARLAASGGLCGGPGVCARAPR
jgi:hypothetical protein